VARRSRGANHQRFGRKQERSKRNIEKRRIALEQRIKEELLPLRVAQGELEEKLAILTGELEAVEAIILEEDNALRLLEGKPVRPPVREEPSWFEARAAFLARREESESA
jgi:hypothetical protein